MEPILAVQDLTMVFSRPGRPALTAVDHVSFQLAPGEVAGLVGESGSGKSTIARLIARLLDATGGTIVLDGKDITRAKGAALRAVYGKLQMVFQAPAASFDPRRTLGDGVGESLRNRRLPKREVRERVADLFEQCGLPADLADRYPHEVSGGQCQRAAIARALANEPKLLIFDEATSALDVTVQRQIMELLAGLQKRGSLSYLFICHNLALVQQFCTTLLVLNEGRIVEQGRPDDVILRPRTDYTRRLVESIFE